MAIKTSYIICNRADKTSTFKGPVFCESSLSIGGSLTFGDASVDNFIIKGRTSTMTVGGANIELGSSYTNGELMEFRTKVTNWTGIAQSFKGYYFRAEAGVGNASYGMRGMEIFGVSNITSGSTGINQLSALYASAYVKAYAGSYTIPYVYSVEANVGTEALTALTITQAACLYATLQTTSGLADYTAWHGIIVEGGNATNAKTYGHAIVIQNPTWSGCGATTWTTGLYITEDCTTAIDINSSCTRGIRVGTHDWGVGDTGISVTATDPLSQVAGKISGADVAEGMYASSYSQLACKYSQNKNLSMAASWNELYINSTDGAVDLTGSAHYYGVWGNVLAWGTNAITSSDGMIAALHGSLTIYTGFVNAGVIAGCAVDAKISLTMGTEGITAAYAIYESRGDAVADRRAAFVYGLYIPAPTSYGNIVDTGIYIGGATTGIDIGACTTGIKVAANIVIPQLMTIGTTDDPIHWDGVASNILIHTENIDTTPGSITANKFVLDAAHSGAVTSGRLEGFRQVVRTYSTNAVTADLRGVVGQMEFSGDMTYQGASTADFSGCYGVIGSIWSGSNVTANTGNLGKLYCIGAFFGLETGTSLSGEDAYFYVYNYGKVCPNAVIKVYNASTPEQPTYFLDMAHAVLGSASGPVYTGSLDDSGTNDILCDGHIKIIVGSTPYYIPIYDTLA